ncbi:hypothetical protein PIB30_069316 [Stylosanthes scabra]|uniref:Uncharacterized protein n=1 Tax=Stylosanthes scabra TaxID=79078 RepID=A0ABU6YQT4_9FABA|nr:hypothetical protein [Stylosanthes scabra]
MCEEGAEWVRHRDGRPHYLRRSDLEPMTKGWYESVCRSILPTTVNGENINVEEIIAEQIYKIPAIPDDTLIPQEPPIVAEAMARTRESRAKNPRQTRQATPPQQQPQFQHQQEFPSARQFKEMEMQRIPVTMANLANHRQREEEVNQERMRYNQILQEIAAQQAKEANKGKTREVVPDSEGEFCRVNPRNSKSKSKTERVYKR